jgi:hypothetical protein
MASKVLSEEEFVLVLNPSATPPEEASENTLYKGSCHCGFLSYTVRLNFTDPHPITGTILSRCNCTICVKYGIITATPAPRSSFTLLSPAGGRAELRDYMISDKLHRWLCPRCGIQCFVEGTYTYQGQEVSYMRINAATLDGRADGGKMEELKDINTRYYGGRDRARIAEGSKEEPWEGGLW